MKITKTGTKGLDLIKKFEGFRSLPYLCPAKVPTIGFGATYYPNGSKVTMNDKPITEVVATELLASMIVGYEKSVDSFCRDDINQNQFDALVSLAFNIGTGALKKSTLIKRVNKDPKGSDIEGAFLMWKNAGGKPILLNRRKREYALYIK